MSDKLTPERAIRLLRAKAAEIEARVQAHARHMGDIDYIHADVALIASILADFIEEWLEDVDQTERAEMDRLRKHAQRGFEEGRGEVRSLGGYRDPEMER